MVQLLWKTMWSDGKLVRTYVPASHAWVFTQGKEIMSPRGDSTPTLRTGNTSDALWLLNE